MSAFTDISAALDSHAEGLGLPLALENKNYKPTIGTLYLRATILPASTAQAGISPSSLEDHLGIYQVDIVVPLNAGNSTANVQADLVAAHFKANQTLTHNGVDVFIKSVSRGAGKRDGAWFTIPVDVSYQSFTKAR